MQKTNVMRILDQKKISYQCYEYDQELTNGILVANALAENPNRVFKTLVTISQSKNHYVFVLPVNKELDLKKAAICVKEKAVSLILQKDLLPLTGYIHGGCSPIGMKKEFPTIVDISSNNYESIIFSAGKVGFQVEINPKCFTSLLKQITYSDISKEA